MFEEIVTEEEIKFNNLEKKIFKFVCNFGCLIIKLILESYDRKIMKARDTKKYRHKGLRKNTSYVSVKLMQAKNKKVPT